MTDRWDPSIPEHKELAHQIEIGNGIPEMRPIQQARDALIKVGFEIQHEEDLAERPDDVAWYYPLEGDVRKAQTVWDIFTCWRTSSSGKFVSHHGLALLEWLRIVPQGTWSVCETLKIAGDALVKTGQLKVSLSNSFRTSLHLISWPCRSSPPCTSSSAKSLSSNNCSPLTLHTFICFVDYTLVLVYTP